MLYTNVGIKDKTAWFHIGLHVTVLAEPVTLMPSVENRKVTNKKYKVGNQMSKYA